jgi:hypothetical protein
MAKASCFRGQLASVPLSEAVPKIGIEVDSKGLLLAKCCEPSRGKSSNATEEKHTENSFAGEQVLLWHMASAGQPGECPKLPSSRSEGCTERLHASVLNVCGSTCTDLMVQSV